jgi:small subunit ribosomal protein S14
MAKKSAVNRNLRVQALVKQYAAKRTALKVSRIALRDLGSHGLIPGLVKSSW